MLKSKEDQIIIKRNQKTRNTIEIDLQLQVENFERILMHYQRDNDELRDMNNILEIKIKIHEI